LADETFILSEFIERAAPVVRNHIVAELRAPPTCNAVTAPGLISGLYPSTTSGK